MLPTESKPTEAKKTEARIKKAYQFLSEFTTRNEAKKVKKELWFMLESALCSDNLDLIEAKERANLIFTYTELKQVVKAINILFPMHEEPKISMTKSNQI